jgi:uncharacterized LabA/DUF88 family protein
MPRDGTKLALFIDGINTHAAARALGFDIDYKRLLTEFRSRGTLVRAFYYTVVIEDQESSPVRPLLDWLDYNGFTVVTKPAKEFDDGEGRRRFKRSMGIELVVDAMDLARQLDEIVLFSGDGDFRALVQALKCQGVRVTVVSTMASQPPIIADELRRQADVFIDLTELQLKIRREEPGRTPRSPSAELVGHSH